MVYGEKPAILAVFGTNCGIAAENRTHGYRFDTSSNILRDAPDRPLPPVSSLDALRDIRLHETRLGRHDIEFLWQFFDTDKRPRPLRFALKRFSDGFAEFDRLGGFQHDHRHARRQMLARNLQTVGRVGIDHGAVTLERVADGIHPVRMAAASRHETKFLHARKIAAGREVKST